MPRQRKVIKYGTGREAILNAVIRVVATKGLRGLTFRAVAAEAQVNNSLVAHHFGTRDALIVAALEWSLERSITVSHLSEFANSGVEFRNAFMDSLIAESELHVFQFEMILESYRNPELIKPVQTLYANYIAAVEESLRALDNDQLGKNLSHMVFATLDGLVLQFLSGSVDKDRTELSLMKLWETITAQTSINAGTQDVDTATSALTQLPT